MSFSLFKKKALSSILAATLAGGAFLSGNVQAIHLAEDNVGQVLLAPMYRTDNGYISEFTIVNPLPDKAVKVRVAIRSHVNSTEVFDFICYMTPTDVCRFQLMSQANTDSATKDEDGGLNLILTSSDDSIKTQVDDNVVDTTVGAEVVTSSHIVKFNGKEYPMSDSLASGNAVFASQIPLSINISQRIRKVGGNSYILKNTKNASGTITAYGDSVIRGHVEVVAAYAVANTVIGYDRFGKLIAVAVRQGMSKASLAQIFDAPRRRVDYSALLHRPEGKTASLSEVEYIFSNGSVTGSQTNTREFFDRLNNVNSYPTAATAVNAADAPYNDFDVDTFSPTNITNIRSTDPSWVQLKGVVTIASDKDRYQYDIPALAGSIGDNVPSGVPSGLGGFSSKGFVNPLGTVLTSQQTNTYLNAADNGLSKVSTTQSVFDGLVVSNPQFDVNTANILFVGNNFGIRPLDGVAHKYVEIERAMAFNTSRGVYRMRGNGDNTSLIATFPLRYIHNNNLDICNASTTMVGSTTRSFSPPFKPDGSVNVNFVPYNDFEESLSTGTIYSPNITLSSTDLVEGNYFEFTDTKLWTYQQGWYRMDVNMSPVNAVNGGCPYPGVPGIVFSHTYKGNLGGGFTSQGWSWTSGSSATQSILSKNSSSPISSCKSASCDTRF